MLARKPTAGGRMSGSAAGDQQARLESGVAVYIPPGLAHQIRVDGDEPLRLVTLFSPPVTPGAYDPKSASK